MKKWIVIKQRLGLRSAKPYCVYSRSGVGDQRLVITLFWKTSLLARYVRNRRRHDTARFISRFDQLHIDIHIIHTHRTIKA